MSNEANCEWHEDEDGQYFTACGNTFEFCEGALDDNGFKFCPYCGNRIIGDNHETP